MLALSPDSTSARRQPRGWLTRLGRWLTAGTLLLALGTLAVNVALRRSARPLIHSAPRDVAARFAIVPGASVRRDGTPSPQLEERLTAALTLVRAGQVERILVSGARNGAYDEAGPMRHWLTQRGVRASRIVEDHAGFRTLDTMERAARVYGVRDAVVCTQAFHLPRAVFLARRAGIATSGLIAGDAARGAIGDLARESLASLMAVIDSYVLGRQPRNPGGPADLRPVRDVGERG